MNPETFMANIREIPTVNVKSAVVEHGSMRYAYDHENADELESPYLFVEWAVGGARGGSCWGGSAEEYTTNENEKNLDGLDDIFIKYWPEMPFLTYKKFVGENQLLVEAFGRTEYYGNRTDYKAKVISIKSLFNFLSSHGKL
jgi:hypothetical protein